ncbi:MAG: NAD-dependent epimerase/dehydratase family protein [Nannocystaceae bacterium]
MTEVLVTGASGHLGNNLVRHLLARGDRVRALVRRTTRSLEELPVTRVQGSLEDLDSLRAASRGVDVVYHLAGLINLVGGQRRLAAANVAGVDNVLLAAREAGVRRLVHCSSLHAFALAHRGPIDESSPRCSPAESSYGHSKALGEARVREAVARGLDAVIVNPTGVIGPYDHGPSRLGRVIAALARGRMPAVIAGGFNFVDVRDVALGLAAAADRGRAGESYLLGGHWRGVDELAAVTCEAAGRRPPRWSCPHGLVRIAAPIAGLAGALGRDPLLSPESVELLQAAHHVIDDRARAELGHAPRPFAETVADTVAWLRDAAPTR